MGIKLKVGHDGYKARGMIGASAGPALRTCIQDGWRVLPLVDPGLLQCCVQTQLQSQGSNTLSATQQTAPDAGASLVL